MIDVALAIDAESQTVYLRKYTTDYDPDTGKAIVASAGVPAIRAAIQPASGRQLADLPEGVREEAKYLMWTRTEVENGDHVAIRRSGILVDVYRIVYVWPRRPIDQFTRAALGLAKQERAAP